jgi:hypothetical protein
MTQNQLYLARTILQSLLNSMQMPEVPNPSYYYYRCCLRLPNCTRIDVAAASSCYCTKYFGTLPKSHPGTKRCTRATTPKARSSDKVIAVLLGAGGLVAFAYFLSGEVTIGFQKTVTVNLLLHVSMFRMVTDFLISTIFFHLHMFIIYFFVLCTLFSCG